MTPQEITSLFTNADGGFRFARWGRPIVPVVFGVELRTLEVLKGAIESLVAMAGHKMAETDPELGANLMVFFCRDWDELREVPNLDRMVPGLEALTDRLKKAGATQYRTFRFDDEGAIKACFAFIHVTAEVAEMPVETLALGLAAQIMLLWGDAAFAATSPLAMIKGGAVLKPDVAGIIRAAYDPVLPAATTDASHALRLFARMQAGAA